MLDVIEKLLILQERDRKLLHLQAELGGIEPQRQAMQARAEAAHGAVEGDRSKLMHLEADRKQIELEIEAQKERIGRYSLHQFQTKKNEEYRALAHEIEGCNQAIAKLVDQQLDLMIQAEELQARLREAAAALARTRRETDQHLADLTEREAQLNQHFTELSADRAQLAAQVDSAVLPRYERLKKSKGDQVVVGIEHGVCGGCHMRLPAQIVLACRGAQEAHPCPNCGRILYYRRGMDLEVAE